MIVMTLSVSVGQTVSVASSEIALVEFVERKLAIVLLDLIGSTRFVQRVGARRAAEWLQYHDRLTRSLMFKFQGREIDRSDGFLLSFERPIDAVNFALLYQASIPAKTRLDTRIGIHWDVVVEVKQDEIFTSGGAKSVELEGLAKNIAARTMSLCQAGQVLLTEEAFQAVKNRTNHWTPPKTRYVCVGLYKFKGVAEPQVIYAVGQTIESLQPPPSSEKVKRLGGPKRVRSRARDRRLMEWVAWLNWRLSILIIIAFVVDSWECLCNPLFRDWWGLDGLFWWVDYLTPLIEEFKQWMKK
jgi:class 3 adenylate cyclase